MCVTSLEAFVRGVGLHLPPCLFFLSLSAKISQIILLGRHTRNTFVVILKFRPPFVTANRGTKRSKEPPEKKIEARELQRR